MKAAVHASRGIEVRDLAKPVPKDDEVLVRVRAASISAADYRIAGMLRTGPGRLVLALRSKPIVLGMEMSGTVEGVGRSITRFRAGDEVFGGTGFRSGPQAEYAVAPEARLQPKPANMTLEESAAVVFGGLTSLSFLREAGVRAGQRVVIYGASGSVGVFAVQLAKHFGAHVTAVCGPGNVEMVKSLGADEVLDYTRQDFSANGRTCDVLVDTVGYAGFEQGLRCLRHGGAFVRISASGGLEPWPFVRSMFTDTIRSLRISMTGTAKMLGGVPKIQPGDHAFLKELVEAGKLRTVIDRQYPLAEVADAYRYASTGHKRGHVLLSFEAASAANAA